MNIDFENELATLLLTVLKPPVNSSPHHVLMKKALLSKYQTFMFVCVFQQCFWT